MTTALVCWIGIAAVLLVLAGLLGHRVTYIETVKGVDVPKNGGWLGILIDYRKRYSLAHFQVVVWSLVLISLVGAIFLARLLLHVAPDQLLNFTVPRDLLILAGISSGTGVLATAIKTTKDTPTIQEQSGPTQFSQMFMVEEGAGTDQVIDPSKFQNFVFTMIGVAAYVLMIGAFLIRTDLTVTGAGLDKWPAIGQQGLSWLVGLSSTAYLGGKLPTRPEPLPKPAG